MGDITHIPHSFYLTSFLPKFCDCCDEFIWGITKQGFYCGVCEIGIHRRCLDSTRDNCVKESPFYKRDLERLDQEGKGAHFVHRWVEAELSLSSMCFVCESSVFLEDIIGYECTRCHKQVHEDCIGENMSCRPLHQNLILSETESSCPLLCFVNSKSGGGLGPYLIEALSALLSPEQVFDLHECGGPQMALEKYRNVKNLRILGCGGDGTIGWIMTYVHNIGFDTLPPIGILPLGTGNDLARTFDWGPGFSDEPISPILYDLENADIVDFDIWKVTAIEHLGSEDRELSFVMNNYTSIGLDASVVLDFHTFREENPGLHFSQWVNKFWYAAWGGKSFFHFPDKLDNIMEIYVDDIRVEIPRGADGIIILNVPFYAGGVDFWGSYVDEFTPTSINDRKLELAVVSGTFHLATVTTNLQHATRLSQGTTIKMLIRSESEIPFHVDGEPQMLCGNSDITITFSHHMPMLKKCTK